MDLSFLDEKGISTAEGIGYTGGEEKYISALQRFFKGYENNRDLIKDLLSTSDTEGYCVRVHSLKSNAKMIGADGLALAFEELENASRNYDITAMKEKTGPALDLYAEVIETIRPIGEMEPVKAAGEIGAEEATLIADKLLEALDDFDDELSAELVGKLKGYPFRLTQKEMLREAEEKIADFMYDEAAELIKAVKPSIE
ncbi:MAG: hypothetical protein J5509_01805 [Lachnospiraceae bacterium]|nr:hypothetical protein [Lachnospiraceae bacterium]